MAAARAAPPRLASDRLHEAKQPDQSARLDDLPGPVAARASAHVFAPRASRFDAGAPHGDDPSARPRSGAEERSAEHVHSTKMVRQTSIGAACHGTGLATCWRISVRPRPWQMGQSGRGPDQSLMATIRRLPPAIQPKNVRSDTSKGRRAIATRCRTETALGACPGPRTRSTGAWVRPGLSQPTPGQSRPTARGSWAGQGQRECRLGSWRRFFG